MLRRRDRSGHRRARSRLAMGRRGRRIVRPATRRRRTLRPERRSGRRSGRPAAKPVQHVAVAVGRPESHGCRPGRDRRVHPRHEGRRSAAARSCQERPWSSAMSFLASMSMSAACRAGSTEDKPEAVADRDHPLHPECLGAFTDQLERERAELARLVEMDVDCRPGDVRRGRTRCRGAPPGRDRGRRDRCRR